MFNWYVDGIQRTYEPRALAPSRVGATRAVSSVDPDESRNPSPYTTPQQEPRKPALVVSQIMTSPVTTLVKDSRISTVVDLFRNRRFRHVPITSSKEVVVGIVSDRDLLKYLAQTFDPLGMEGHLQENVSAVMKSKVLTAMPGTPVREAARIMFEERIGCIPVLNDVHRIVGIVTRSDILRTVMNHAPLELWV